MTILALRQNVRMRRNILRGVFEQNLNLVGRGNRKNRSFRLTFPGKIALSLAAAFVMVLVHGSFLTVQWLPENQIRAGLLLKDAAAHAVAPVTEGTFVGKDYQALLHNEDVPLWRLLGLEVKTIMIDPGHGGRDSGAIGKLGTYEKDIVLDIGRRLLKRLKGHGNYRVVMSRSDDSKLSLNERVMKSKAEDADIFISLHLNYLPKKPINIIETFYFGPPEDAKAEKLAERENNGSKFGLSDFRVMIEKMTDTLKLQESKELAMSIQGNLFAKSSQNDKNIKDYGIKRAPFVVLLNADVPAVLVEIACLSNAEEEKNLNTESHRENIAQYLETGILDYLSKGESQYVAKR